MQQDEFVAAAQHGFSGGSGGEAGDGAVAADALEEGRHFGARFAAGEREAQGEEQGFALAPGGGLERGSEFRPGVARPVEGGGEGAGLAEEIAVFGGDRGRG